MRDEFSATVKDVLAKRVRQLCSNPKCLQSTSGPQADPRKAVNLGVAAHITAASAEGPRFEVGMDAFQRSSAENGIWLCQNCAKLVDNDPIRYTIRILHRWKADAESEAATALECRDGRASSGSADVGNRPWISLTCRLGSGFTPGTTHLGIEGYYLSLNGVAKNEGPSPATNVIFRAELGLLLKGRNREDMLNGFCDRFRNIVPQLASTIFPGASLDVSHELFLAQKDIDDALSAVDLKAIHPVVYGCIQYAAADANGTKQTRFVHDLCRVRDNGHPMVLLQDGQDWLRQRIALAEPGLVHTD